MEKDRSGCPGAASESIGYWHRILTDFDTRASQFADLCRGDATRMEFADESFDFVYLFHALEHIPDFRAVLHEMRRVLRPNGGWMIGTPNSKRIIGFLVVKMHRQQKNCGGI